MTQEESNNFTCGTCLEPFDKCIGHYGRGMGYYGKGMGHYGRGTKFDHSETAESPTNTPDVFYLPGKTIKLSFKDEHPDVPEVDIPMPGKFVRMEYETHTTDDPNGKWEELSNDGWELVEITDTFVKVKRIVKPSIYLDEDKRYQN